MSVMSRFGDCVFVCVSVCVFVCVCTCACMYVCTCAFVCKNFIMQHFTYTCTLCIALYMHILHQPHVQ